MLELVERQRLKTHRAKEEIVTMTFRTAWTGAPLGMPVHRDQTLTVVGSSQRQDLWHPVSSGRELRSGGEFRRLKGNARDQVAGNT